MCPCTRTRLNINDLINCCKGGKIRIFADDTSIFITGKNIHQVINISENIMSLVNKWFTANKLTLSTDKSSFIIFKTAQSQQTNIPDELYFDSKYIRRENTVKYLGLTFDQHLNWNTHITNMCNSLKSCFPIFYSIRKYINLEQARAIYYNVIFKN